jgi:hypothetical protein
LKRSNDEAERRTTSATLSPIEAKLLGLFIRILDVGIILNVVSVPHWWIRWTADLVVEGLWIRAMGLASLARHAYSRIYVLTMFALNMQTHAKLLHSGEPFCLAILGKAPLEVDIRPTSLFIFSLSTSYIHCE